MLVNDKLDQNCHFQTPHRTPVADLVFWVAPCSFFGRFQWKRCQNAQENILHHIKGSPKESETSPFYSPPLFINKNTVRPSFSCQPFVPRTHSKNTATSQNPTMHMFFYFSNASVRSFLLDLVSIYMYISTHHCSLLLYE